MKIMQNSCCLCFKQDNVALFNFLLCLVLKYGYRLHIDFICYKTRNLVF